MSTQSPPAFAPASSPPDPPAPPRQWTADQQQAITHTQSDLLVSAAAGSGKTAVLAERCAYLVCDAPDPCDVDQLLVVTFTEAAAAEMRRRIGQALHDRLSSASTPDQPRLARQIALLDRAQISTLHAFCANLIRRHHAQLGLDPAFKVIDGDEAALIRRQSIKRVFAARYDAEIPTDAAEPPLTPAGSPATLSRFVDDYADGNDEPLMEEVIAAHELLQSIADPQAWQEQATRRLIQAVELPLEQNELGQKLVAMLERKLESLLVQCERTGKAMSAMPGFGAYLAILRDWYKCLVHCRKTLDQAGVAALAEVVQGLQNGERLPPMKADMPGKDAAKSLMDAMKKAIGKDGPLSRLLRFSPGQWQDGMTRTLPFARLLLDLVREFSREYALAKTRQRGLDFADLERYALKALTVPPDDSDPPSGICPPALECRRRYRHILVDEYQDINEVQDAILSAAGGRTNAASDRQTDPLESPRPTMFYVGDIKQSIYRFRLADPQRFLGRMKRYEDPAQSAGRLISLGRNFRSRPTLLNAINAVFQRLMTEREAEIEYDASHHLHAGAEWPPDSHDLFKGAPIELHMLPRDVFPSTQGEPSGEQDAPAHAPDDQDNDIADTEAVEREALLIARRIEQLMKQKVVDKDGAIRPLEYRDIVVLLRSAYHKANEYASILRQCGIPVHTPGGGDFFQAAEVRDVLALLAILDNPLQDIPLTAFLRGPLSGNAAGRASSDADKCGHGVVNESDLAAIRVAFSRGDEPPPFHVAVRRYAAERDDPLAHRLQGVFKQLDQWRELARRRPVANLLWTIYQQSGWLAYVAGLSNGRQRVANLLHLHQRALQFGGFDRQGLWRFIAFMEQLKDDLSEPPIASEAENVVRISTIHSAKGLEFPVVFLADLGKKFNLADASGSILLDRHEGIGLKVADEKLRARYPSLAWTILNERIKRRTIAEELRMLYVGMTRAREHLICIATSHASALPHATSGNVIAVTDASTPLDWLGPIAADLEQQGALTVTLWPATEVAAWPSPRQMRPHMSPWQAARAQLKPLSPPPEHNESARRIMDRLTHPYAFDAFTTVAASTAVTSEKRAADIPSNDVSNDQPDASTPLELPSSSDNSIGASRGSAVHQMLRFLDFSRPCDPDDLRSQLQSMLAQHQMSSDEADRIDLADIHWLLNTPQGELLRRYAGVLWRELPFTWPRPPALLTPVDPLDQQIIRGRLDVLIPTDAGLVLLDYKTDHVIGPQLHDRIARYEPQLSLYSQALAQITGQSVAGAYLMFLHARTAHRVS